MNSIIEQIEEQWKKKKKAKTNVDWLTSNCYRIGM